MFPCSRCVSGPEKRLLFSLLLLCMCVVAAQETSAVEKTVTTSTQSDLCTYTLVVHEFDASKCTAYKPEYILADGADRRRPHDDAPSTYRSASAEGSKSRRPRLSGADKPKGGPSRSGASGEDDPEIGTLLKDVENKLLEEMVRNRALNSTLSRHESLLQEARNTLESYRSNFTSVFYQMMQVERKLHRQRRINRSLNKKLSNVILDVVEVNNVISKKLPTSGGPVTGNAAGKKFEVESSSSIRACPGISNVSKQHQGRMCVCVCF